MVKANGAKAAFAPPRDYRMDSRMPGDAAPSAAVADPGHSQQGPGLEINDPTFFVAFSLAEGTDAIRLVGAPRAAPRRWSAEADRPPAGQQLSEAFFQSLNAAQSLAVEVANRVIVACP